MSRPTPREVARVSRMRPLTEVDRVLRDDGTTDVDATLARFRAENETSLDVMTGRITHLPTFPLWSVARRSLAERVVRRALDAQEQRLRTYLETGEPPI